jgi:hypothetical protein
MRTNLRFGCTILRHYLDMEKGDLYRALGRYNGSLGKPEYPNMVRGAWERQWAWRRYTPCSPYPSFPPAPNLRFAGARPGKLMKRERESRR